MPYPPDQAQAIFLSMKKKKGTAAAKAFAKKHGKKAPKKGKKGRTTGYMTRRFQKGAQD